MVPSGFSTMFETLAPGLEKCGVLVRFRASARNSIFQRSVKLISRNSPPSKLNVPGPRTESNAEGKYRTLRPRPLDAPLPANGSLVVQASGGTCRVGARYPSITLSGRGKSYLLQDVEVVDCGVGATGAQFTLVYRKVTVKGWNPEKKEL